MEIAQLNLPDMEKIIQKLVALIKLFMSLLKMELLKDLNHVQNVENENSFKPIILIIKNF